jgi:hypothetical protein
VAKNFICVRIQSMNEVNISLFQFERDLTWMAFFMDANDHFYARYGGRDISSPEKYLSRESLLHTMREVLKLHAHKAVQTSRYEPDGEPRRTPEQIPPMRAMMARRKENKCIHCHDVKVAELRHLQSQGKFTRYMVFTYPTPAAIGIEVDTVQQNKVQAIVPNSPAEGAGIRPGEMLRSADGQRILTAADFSRVLELTPPDAVLPIEIESEGRTRRVKVKLTGEWRRTEDPAWRETLHVAGPNGGFWGEKLSPEQRRSLGIEPDGMAVRVTAIWGNHTREAGIKIGDIVVSWDHLRADLAINQLHAHLNMNRNYGDSVPLVVRRDGKQVELQLHLPNQAPVE